MNQFYQHLQSRRKGATQLSLHQVARRATSQRDFAGKQSFPIPVWNGLLEHRPRIGGAIWEFLWCLDRITSEQDGIGLVLGGAPVKAARIAANLQEHPDQAKKNLRRLEAGGYIRRRRTPYGMVLSVLNSCKFGIWRKVKRKNESSFHSSQDKTNRPRQRRRSS